MSFMAMHESSVSCNMVSEQCERESRARSSVKHCFSVIETSSLESSIRDKEEVRGSEKFKGLLEQPCLELKVEWPNHKSSQLQWTREHITKSVLWKKISTRCKILKMAVSDVLVDTSVARTNPGSSWKAPKDVAKEGDQARVINLMSRVQNIRPGEGGYTVCSRLHRNGKRIEEACVKHGRTTGRQDHVCHTSQTKTVSLLWYTNTFISKVTSRKSPLYWN